MHPALVTEDSGSAVPVDLVTKADWPVLRDTLAPAQRRYAEIHHFAGGEGEYLAISGADGEIARVLYGLGENVDPRAMIGLSARLPGGDYRIEGGRDLFQPERLAALFVDGAYRFTKYVKSTAGPARLVLPEGSNAAEIDRQALAASRVRDLVNTPAEDMGPDEIEHVIRNLAMGHGAAVSVTAGDELLKQNYPMIHAVGRAGPKAPRLIELTWGREDHPVLALVGKGVCFDTGGLNLKVGNYMRDMKKDMGGAAHAIGLAQLVMSAKLPVRLVLLIPAVENSVSASSFRPGDVFPTRKGLNVEIDNTDAEGRLVLSDALARACEHMPDLILDYATLTGAARVALGPDLAPFYTDDPDLAAAIDIGSFESGDPVWRMPLWAPYFADLKSSVSDFQNSGGPMAGSITAALFLKQFVDTRRWMHFDIWAWRTAKYGRPAGAATCGLHASWKMLRNRYGE